MSIAITLHLLAAVIWVGGMFFAYQCLRPVAAQVLEPPARLTLWRQVFARFFPWVWGVVLVLPITGHWMIELYGGFSRVGLHVHLMLALGYLMVALFLHLYFAPFGRLKRAVDAQNWAEGGQQLNQIRRIVGINLLLGLVVVLVASGGRYLIG